MFFLFTHQRPEKCQKTIDACHDTGMTEPCVVLMGNDAGDYDLKLPDNFKEFRFSKPKTLGQKMNWAFSRYYKGQYFGFLSDDCIPLTKGWDLKLVDKAGKNYWANPADDLTGPERMACCSVWGGALVRHFGSWSPMGLHHFKIDRVWETLTQGNDLYVEVPEVKFKHFHFLNGNAPKDATHDKSDVESRDKDIYRVYEECQLIFDFKRMKHFSDIINKNRKVKEHEQRKAKKLRGEN